MVLSLCQYLAIGSIKIKSRKVYISHEYVYKAYGNLMFTVPFWAVNTAANDSIFIRHYFQFIHLYVAV